MKKNLFDYYDILKEKGIDTSSFISLSIKKNKDNVVIQNENGEPIYSNILSRVLNGEEISEDTKIAVYAKNSQFYGKVMHDGNIFNPYMHRRFLPSMYIYLFKALDMDMVDESGVIQKCMSKSLVEMLDYILTELKTLQKLSKQDTISYKQRAACLPFTLVREFYIQLIGVWSWYTYLPDSISINDQAAQATNYKELLHAMQRLKDMKKTDFYLSSYYLENRHPTAELKVKTLRYYFTLYYGAGVYYTLISLSAFKRNLILPDSMSSLSRMEISSLIRKELYESTESFTERGKFIYKNNKLLKEIIELNKL